MLRSNGTTAQQRNGAMAQTSFAALSLKLWSVNDEASEVKGHKGISREGTPPFEANLASHLFFLINICLIVNGKNEPRNINRNGIRCF
jgi:hypothetical protein